MLGFLFAYLCATEAIRDSTTHRIALQCDAIIAMVTICYKKENALLKSDNAVLRNEFASLAKRLEKVRVELDAIKRAVARGLNHVGNKICEK